jgi:hypothetical protein
MANRVAVMILVATATGAGYSLGGRATHAQGPHLLWRSGNGLRCGMSRAPCPAI